MSNNMSLNSAERGYRYVTRNFGDKGCNHRYVNDNGDEVCIKCGLVGIANYTPNLNFAERGCNHQYVVDNGEEVCINCGLVGVPCMLPEQPLQENYFRGSEFILRNELLDVLAVINCDTGFVIDQCITKIQRVSRELHQDDLLRLDIRKHADRCKIAFIVWDVLNELRIPRVPQDIACVFNITTADIQKAERDLPFQTSYCPPSYYVPRIASALTIPYPVETRLEEIAKDYLDTMMCKPEALIAALIACFADEWKQYKKKFHVTDSKFTARITSCFSELNRKNITHRLGLPKGALPASMRRHISDDIKCVVRKSVCSLSNI